MLWSAWHLRPTVSTATGAAPDYGINHASTAPCNDTGCKLAIASQAHPSHQGTFVFLAQVSQSRRVARPSRHTGTPRQPMPALPSILGARRRGQSNKRTSHATAQAPPRAGWASQSRTRRRRTSTRSSATPRAPCPSRPRSRCVTSGASWGLCRQRRHADPVDSLALWRVQNLWPLEPKRLLPAQTEAERVLQAP